jgi:hypothetical protein
VRLTVSLDPLPASRRTAFADRTAIPLLCSMPVLVINGGRVIGDRTSDTLALVTGSDICRREHEGFSLHNDNWKAET